MMLLKDWAYSNVKTLELVDFSSKVSQVVKEKGHQLVMSS
jgi:hypothetical protein